MKNILHLAILLTITCSVRSQQNNHCLTDHQLKIAYKKVIRGEQAEQKLDSCKTVVGGLNDIIFQQDLDLQAQIAMVKAQNDSIAAANEKYNSASVKLQQAKDKKRPWYEWAALIAAFITGVSIK